MDYKKISNLESNFRSRLYRDIVNLVADKERVEKKELSEYIAKRNLQGILDITLQMIVDENITSSELRTYLRKAEIINTKSFIQEQMDHGIFHSEKREDKKTYLSLI